jgi:hypothetical protein
MGGAFSSFNNFLLIQIMIEKNFKKSSWNQRVEFYQLIFFLTKKNFEDTSLFLLLLPEPLTFCAILIFKILKNGATNGDETHWKMIYTSKYFQLKGGLLTVSTYNCKCTRVRDKKI